MIAYLDGVVQFLEDESLVLNVEGVGYELRCAQSTLDHVQPGSSLALRVYTHLREQALELFGFLHATEKQMFLSLIKINGIGPRMAMKILSSTDLNVLVDLIEEGDVKGLTKLPKVGKKTAEQIILALKGKLVMDDESKSTKKGGARGQVVSALVHLGFRLNDVEVVVDELDPALGVEEGVRAGLSALTRN